MLASSIHEADARPNPGGGPMFPSVSRPRASALTVCALGIGLCSVEEVGTVREAPQSSRDMGKIPPQSANCKGFSSSYGMNTSAVQLDTDAPACRSPPETFVALRVFRDPS